MDIDNGSLQIYPIPMAEQATLTFIAPEKGNTVIDIVDLSGKTVCQISKLLLSGAHSFRISGISWGMYFVKVIGKNYIYSTKLISHSSFQTEPRIEHVSSTKVFESSQIKSTAAAIDMPYTEGDQLLYQGSSGIYSTIITDVPVSSKTTTFNFASCTDADNNQYSIIQIGTQTWMAENLNVGIRINVSKYSSDNDTIEKYCYNDLEDNCTSYGALYQWKEMMKYYYPLKRQGICPNGWHLPTGDEWWVLTIFLGGDGVAGGKIKSTGTIESGTGLWRYPNAGATNESGFNAIPAGSAGSNGTFSGIEYNAMWWCTSGQSETPDCWEVVRDYKWITNFSTGNSQRHSVRCIMDKVRPDAR
jgi:uncharacterized protein (TIGR02145 family)